jgi:DNA-binding transcriptional ArsR family regulator
MQEPAVLRKARVGPAGRTIAIAPVGYEQFRQMAWSASETICDGSPRGVVPICELRRALRQVPAATFNQHLLRLERNGLVYLIPPEDPEMLKDDEREESLAHPAGDLRSFLLWMGPKTRPAYFWD